LFATDLKLESQFPSRPRQRAPAATACLRASTRSLTTSLPLTERPSAVQRAKGAPAQGLNRNISLFVFLLLPERKKRLFYG
jgi:hypothetical protein